MTERRGLPQLNRALVMILHQRPYLEWVREVDPEAYDDREDWLEPSPYLMSIRLMDDPEVELRRVAKRIFEIELGMVEDDEDAWPVDRSWKTFEQWFGWQVIFDVHDAGYEDPLRSFWDLDEEMSEDESRDAK